MKELLDEAYDRYAVPSFVESDPVQVPRSFEQVADAEVMAFLTATIAWGQRPVILRNAWRIVDLFDGSPHAFIMQAGPEELARIERFQHRTFNGIDLTCFVLAMRHLYLAFGSLENSFLCSGAFDTMPAALARFRDRFFSTPHPLRSEKHVADVRKGAHAKRLNMFMRWMVRPDDSGIDLGLWKRIRPAHLLTPMDVHTGRMARALGLLSRKQDDLKSVQELTDALKRFDPEDPVKYDIALFSLGVHHGDQ
ncbi:MAG: TIGR02757 family protein [Flavobacteriales bacterium]|nr:TIGR02757 family protein [Flavobacteriales bacterium]